MLSSESWLNLEAGAEEDINNLDRDDTAMRWLIPSEVRRRQQLYTGRA
jgi:hypothetical protein